MGDSRKLFRDIFKRGKKKQPGNEDESESHGSASREDTPSLDASRRPFPLRGYSEKQVAVASNDAWTNLMAFSSLLQQNSSFARFAAVMDDLSWFIREHENVVGVQEKHTELHIQLEVLFKDLHLHFSSESPPAMTANMINLCAAIGTELQHVYGTQDRNAISRLLKAEYDLDKITGCYRRIQNHLERVMLNATMNIPIIENKLTMETRLRQLYQTKLAYYDSGLAHTLQRRGCTPNTREKVLLGLRAWKDSADGQNVCWMSGMAGTGKTTIMNTFCSTLDQDYELGASFFCTRTTPDCRDVKLILPAIAYQLARFSDPFRGALVQVLEEDPDVHRKALRVQFQRMILEPLQDVRGSLPNNLVVAIDALDECDDRNGVEQILELLLEKASDLPVKFLISSRPEYHIRDRIGRSVRKTQVTLHELEENIVKADIETYLREELTFLSIPLTEEQLEILVKQAGVLFIYAATIIWYIKGAKADPVKRLNAVLRAPGLEPESSRRFQQIDKLYKTVLNLAFDDSDMEHVEIQRTELVLHTIICAQEPLIIEALSGLLDLTSSEVSAALRPLWSVLHVSGQDASDRVNILHPSFPDYILDPTRSGRFACDAEIHHGRLAQHCFRRIGRNIPQFNICGLESSYQLDEDIPDLDDRVKKGISTDLLYACQYWAVHLCLGAKSDKIATELDEFLSKRLLLWMEVLNLTKRAEKGIGLVEQCMSWLRYTGGFKSTMSLARDARRLTTMFATSPVSRSTPHLYVSMLASWPHHVPTSDYARRAPQVVGFKGIEIAERQLGLLSLIPVGSDVRCVSYSSDGRFFAACTWDGRILIWDAGSCRVTIDPIVVHSGPVQAIAISPDGTRICSGSHDGTVRIWDTQNGQLVAGPLGGHRDNIWSANFSPDGRWLASGSADGILCIWSTTSWQQQLFIECDGAVYSVGFSLDSTIVATGCGSVIRLWDLLSCREISDPFQGHIGFIRCLAFLPDGKHLVSGSSDCTICVWDVSSSRIAFGPFQGHTDGVSDLKVSPDGRSLVSAAADDTIRIWNTETWQSHILFRDTGVRSLMFSPDGSRLVSGSADGNVRIWEGEIYFDKQATVEQVEGHDSWVRSVSFSPRGTHVISGSDDATMCIWDLQSRQLIHSPLQHTHPILFIGVSADSEHIFSITQDRMIHVWSKQAGELEYTIGPIETNNQDNLVYDELWPAAFLFDHKRIACGSKSGQLHTQEGSKPTYSLTGSDRAVYSIAFSPDGQSFTSGTSDGALMIWDASTGERLFGPLTGHSESICSIAYSPDSILLASGSWDRTIRLWSSLTGAPVGVTFQGHTRVIRSVAFSPSGNHLVSGSEDMTVRIWDVIDGQSIAIFQGHTDKVLSVAYSPGGTQIVSGSADTTIRLWNVPAQRDLSSGTREERAVNAEEYVPSSEWDMGTDGWVRDAKKRLLVWVPPDLRTTLLRPHSGLILRQGCVELDFANARIGDEWQRCYEPFPPASQS